ncbi:cytochrome P450 [Streptomyces apocyni]|uniref:cytochrome P450 n=1 Tax=Streptomyces apocyni TaxID=2654677 RepID=UPI0012EA4336|nr:cytochrome P450 [Streptomyces apocyni]
MTCPHPAPGTRDQLPDFPFPGSSYRGPAPLFARLRAERPVAEVAWSGGGRAWLVTRHQDIRTVLDDPRFSRAASYAPDAPTFKGLFQVPPGVIISIDPPDHTRLRALAEQAFSPARVEAMRPRVRELANARLDVLEREGRADLVGGFAAPLALGVICEILGVPEPDREQFHGWVRQFADTSAPEEQAAEGGEKIGGYLAGLVAAKQQDPADDVLSALIAARSDTGDRLSFDELVGLAFTLLGSGFDSTAGQLGNFALALLVDHPGSWRHLGAHPEEIPRCVEELLRTVNLNGNDTSGLPRIATEDVTIGEVTIPSGDAVFLAFTSANRDTSVFPDADRADLARADNPHLAFGYGAHRCMGASLARLELTVAIEELTRRFPDARLAVPEHALRWRIGDVNHNLLALPVEL